MDAADLQVWIVAGGIQRYAGFVIRKRLLILFQERKQIPALEVGTVAERVIARDLIQVLDGFEILLLHGV